MAKKQNEESNGNPANARNDAPNDAENNLRFYNMGCDVPSDALKTIQAGRLRGMTDVNPMWRMKRMTEIFGPCGIGWKYTIDKQWVEPYGDEVKCFCNVSLFVRDPETKQWSDAIPGVGGSAIVSREKGGLYVNDEGYKMALTDALSIAMKPLGIGGNIWYGSKATGHNESKYEADTRVVNDQPASTPNVAFTGAQLKQALDELKNVKTEQEFKELWKRTPPALRNNGTEFYNKACETLSKIRASQQSK